MAMINDKIKAAKLRTRLQKFQSVTWNVGDQSNLANKGLDMTTEELADYLINVPTESERTYNINVPKDFYGMIANGKRVEQTVENMKRALKGTGYQIVPVDTVKYTIYLPNQGYLTEYDGKLTQKKENAKLFTNSDLKLMHPWYTGLAQPEWGEED